MPYIPKQSRLRLDAAEYGEKCENAGDLNFAITTLILGYLGDSDPHYADFNEVIGVLECAKLELYRRMAAPYEDRKVEENGDVYFAPTTVPE